MRGAAKEVRAGVPWRPLVSSLAGGFFDETCRRGRELFRNLSYLVRLEAEGAGAALVGDAAVAVYDIQPVRALVSQTFRAPEEDYLSSGLTLTSLKKTSVSSSWFWRPM